MLNDLEKALQGATKDWATAKKRSDRHDRIRSQDWRRLQRQASSKVTIKDAAWSLMRGAYMHASANNTLPANARQIMYATRPDVLRMTGGECWKQSSYFTQHLLPDYVEAYPQATADWDVVFDARGHIHEPHTGRTIELGTLQVRHYQGEWTIEPTFKDPLRGFTARTCGPTNRFSSVLFVEKEGFNPLLEQSRLADRLDIAVMSTKGMSVTAARHLVEELSRAGTTIYVARDFDKAGFSIAATLANNTRRYTFDHRPNVIDLGLRLEDIEAMSLTSEPVDYGKSDPRPNLRRNGASDDEIDFLVGQGGGWLGWTGERVELNAMASDQFIVWLEERLTAHGVVKTLPDEETLTASYREALRLAEIRKTLDPLLSEIDHRVGGIDAPPDLAEQIREAFGEDPTLSWDQAIAQMFGEGDE